MKSMRIFFISIGDGRAQIYKILINYNSFQLQKRNYLASIDKKRSSIQKQISINIYSKFRFRRYRLNILFSHVQRDIFTLGTFRTGIQLFRAILSANRQQSIRRILGVAREAVTSVLTPVSTVPEIWLEMLTLSQLAT